MQEFPNPYESPVPTAEELAVIARIDEFRRLLANRFVEAGCAFSAVGGTAYVTTQSPSYGIVAGIGGAIVSLLSK